ncbi:ABC transporter ATP-binding protein [Clostridium perfringens]|nr:ABC transporter ATP-binding protein [Clostridium perfringens]
MYCITTDNLNISYGSIDIVKDLNLKIPKGKITTIIGSNGCGKSTVLKTIARILTPKSGEIYINEKSIKEQSSKELAKTMAVLPQSPQAPNGLTVEELIAYGRFPHQKGFGKLKKEDKEIIEWALEATGLIEFRERDIEDLSGGQRQRAWIAMALAQQTDILILDEPTTYLDLAHQLEILNLLKELNEKQGTTIVMVIHELNNAARFADYMIGMKSGKIACEGTAYEVMTKDNLKELFNIDAEIIQDPRNNRPVCVTYDMIQK